MPKLTKTHASRPDPAMPATGTASPPLNVPGPGFPVPKPYRALQGSALPMREFLFGPAYQRHQVTLTIAAGGTGKTSLCIAEAVAMASGSSFIEKSHRPLRVWIYNGEEPLDEIDRRIKAAAMAQKLDHEALKERLFVNSGRSANRINLSSGADKARLEVNEPLVRSLIDSIAGQIDVVIVDPFISTHSVSENDNTGIDMMVKAWARIAEQGKCAVHLVHHASKGGSSDSADASRGASSLAAAARHVRNLSQLGPKDTERLGVRDGSLQRYVTIRATKQNNSGESAASYIRLSSVAIGNDPNPDNPGDIVGVVESFAPTIDQYELDDIVSAALDALDSLETRDVYSSNSPDWFGYAIAEVLGADGKTHRQDIESVIDLMLRSRVIETYNRPGKNGRKRDCLRTVGSYPTTTSMTASSPAPAFLPSPEENKEADSEASLSA